MNFQYLNNKEINVEQLRELFLSVNWESGKYPEKLRIAFKNSDLVYTAWDGDKLVGLINSISDGIMTAYFHYMLVRPEYQGSGIGKHLLNLMLKEYADYKTKVLVSYDEALGFYEKCGFEIGKGKPMFIHAIVD